MAPLLKFGATVLAAYGALALWERARRPAPIPPTPEALISEPLVDAWVLPADDGYTLHWRPHATTVTISASPTPQPETAAPPLAVVDDGRQSVTLSTPFAGRPFFTLYFSGGELDGQTIVTSLREIPLQDAVNFRDIGGYRTLDGHETRWGLVYRAGQLSGLGEADLATLAGLKLSLVCDLRTPEETTEAPDALPDGVHYRHIPVQTRSSRRLQAQSLLITRRMDDFMRRVYTEVAIDQNAAVIGAIFRHIADGDLPLAYHCTAGKDRTGITTALLLALLGVPDETIQADYSLSNRYFAVYQAIGEAAVTPFKRFGITLETLQPVFVANPVMIAATLDHVRSTYGGVETYLVRQAGLTAAQLDRIRERLLI